MPRLIAAFAIFFAAVNLLPAHAQVTIIPIGTIQGAAGTSPFLNRFVNFRGVVVGRYEDENTRGDVYYTLFVQSLPQDSDGDPSTSDGITVFLGREPRPDIALGARVLVGGKVTEFYGLTEIDDDGLVVTVEETSGTQPDPVPIDPPADMTAQAIYFEALEGMRVAYKGPVVVAGPTHEGCGFAVIGEAFAADLPVVRRQNDDPVGRVVPVLYPSDRLCDDIPQVKVGDRITGMAGALTYNFDQFKIVFDSAAQLKIEPAEIPPVSVMPAFGPNQIVLATLNTEDYFDTVRDTDEEGEPVLTAVELAGRQTKLVHLLAHILACPTLIALQEVEHASLLGDLSAALAPMCGFVYEVSHLDSPDARGIDNALLSNPRRVVIDSVALARACSPVPTEVFDPAAACGAGEEPLFGRPPLRIEARVDGEPLTLFVNHFKSKRGGELETDLERIRQAVFLNGVATELLAADSEARVIALGDFNDSNLSPAIALLTDPAQGGRFADPHAALPAQTRYSYNFGGVVEQIDAILLSPALMGEVGWVDIVHSNTDFPAGWRMDTSPMRLPFRASDHDVPVIAFGQLPATPEPPPTATATLVAGGGDPTEQAAAGQSLTGEPLPEATTPTAAVLTTAVATAQLEPVATVRQPNTTQEPTRPAPWLLLLGGVLLAVVIVAVMRLRH